MNRSRPRSGRRPARRRFALVVSFALASLVVLSVATAPAHATSTTMKRSLTNIVFGPVDFVLSPLTSATGVYSNLRDIDDSPGVRFAYPIPAYMFALGTNVGGSALRFITGLLQFIPAVPLMFSESDLDSVVYSPSEDARALYENEIELWEDSWLPIRFGLNYTINDY